MQDTICAIATAIGGALGIIRISGTESIRIASEIFYPKNNKAFADMPVNYAVFGIIKDNDGSTLDEVLATSFKAPHSYTGEDSVEFSCHGSAFILNRIIQILVKKGCRLANPGEYTERAFLNGKMDLSQAEAVADLIASRSEVSHKVAINQLKGGFKERISVLREKLKKIQTLLELELDFSEHEDLDFADRAKLITIAEDIKHDMLSLTRSFTSMNAVKNGVPVAIIGNTNVGKSTLMNALLSDSRAIVSNIPGTTRDTIEENIIINGIEFRLIDTAGIRETNDAIENLGINKTFEVIDKSQIILWVTSAPEVLNGTFEDDTKNLKEIFSKGKTLLSVLNKTDKLDGEESVCKAKCLLNKHLNKILEYTDNQNNTDDIKSNIILLTSAKNKQGIEEIENNLSIAAHIENTNTSDSLVINERHYQSLSKALINIDNVIQGMNEGLPADLISQDIREILFHFSSISGEITSQEVLNNIFSHFCIGK